MITYVKEILEPAAIGTIKKDPEDFEELILLSSFSIAVSLKRIADSLDKPKTEYSYDPLEKFEDDLK